MTTLLVAQFMVVLSFSCIHIFAGRLRFLDEVPRSRWLSLSGGISVSYVFLHIFPELAAVQKEMIDSNFAVVWIEHHAYLVSLLGITLFYGLERYVLSTQREQGLESSDEQQKTSTGMGVFWIHIGSFILYNTLVGYLVVHRESQTLSDLGFFMVALGLHFLVNDHSLRQAHKNTYRKIGRWLLAGATLFGWGLGQITEVHTGFVGVLFAFLAGGIILNVLKEELPEKRKSRFVPFALGAAGYAVLLLL